MRCDECGTETKCTPDKRGSERLPNGWKRFKDRTWCKGCWNGRYVIRACVFPVASPVGLEWPAFRTKLGEGWALTTQLANWTVTELAKVDIVRSPDMDKLPGAPRPYLYPAARAAFPALDPQAVVAVQHSVSGRYNRARLETVWRNAASLQRFRYPFPYIVGNQGWSARWLTPEEHVPIVDFRLGGERIGLRLLGGNGFRRQLAQFGQLVDGEALPGSLEIYRQRGSLIDHRSRMADAASAGGGTVFWTVMIKLVLWLPRGNGNGDKTMRVATGKDFLMRAELDGREPWTLNADHVRHWVAEHRLRLDRFSDDSKMEKRWPSRMRRQMNDNRAMWVAKHHRRMATFCHEASAALVKFGVRQHVSRLDYNDTEKGYIAEFPWFNMKQLVEQKCSASGITFASAEVVNEIPDALEHR